MKLPAMMTTAVGLLMELSLSSCNQTSAQATFVNQNAQATKAVLDFKACRRQVREEESFSTISKYLTDLETGQFTIEQLANQNKPTQDEARTYAKFYDANTPCGMNFLQQISTVRPDTTTIFIDSQEAYKKSVLNLVTRKISWGNYSNRVADSNAIKIRALSEADTQNQQQLQTRNTEEIAQRRQAVISYLHVMQNQQLITSINRPIVTNCNAYGSSVNCISQ